MKSPHAVEYGSAFFVAKVKQSPAGTELVAPLLPPEPEALLDAESPPDPE
jgi:hypothetical protein